MYSQHSGERSRWKAARWEKRGSWFHLPAARRPFLRGRCSWLHLSAAGSKASGRNRGNQRVFKSSSLKKKRKHFCLGELRMSAVAHSQHTWRKYERTSQLNVLDPNTFETSDYDLTPFMVAVSKICPRLHIPAVFQFWPAVFLFFFFPPNFQNEIMRLMRDT